MLPHHVNGELIFREFHNKIDGLKGFVKSILGIEFQIFRFRKRCLTQRSKYLGRHPAPLK